MVDIHLSPRTKSISNGKFGLRLSISVAVEVLEKFV